MDIKLFLFVTLATVVASAPSGMPGDDAIGRVANQW